MSHQKAKWKEPSFILDTAQTTVAIAIALVLALDMTGVWSGLPWLSTNPECVNDLRQLF
jgi:hypothetical protein